MNKSEYQTLWREIRKTYNQPSYSAQQGYRKTYRRKCLTGTMLGLQLFDNCFAEQLNGQPISLDEYYLFMYTCEQQIKYTCFHAECFRGSIQVMATIDGLRRAQYCFWTKYKNELIKRQKAGEELSEEELKIINWRKPY